MKVGLIGCGRVGLTIAYFLGKNKSLCGVYDTDKRALKKAIRILKIKDNPEYEKLIKESRILLFATPDDEILNAYNQAKRYITERKYLFHFSGLLPAEVFPEKNGIYRAVVHPFATFPQIKIPPERDRYILFFQGDRKSFEIAQKIFTKKNFLIRRIDKKNKPFYHLLGVFASNLLVALIEITRMIQKKLRWKDKDFNDVILPIIFETLNNIEENGMEKGLSGPIARGDIKTIKKHLRILKSEPEILNAYSALSNIIIKYAPGDKQKILKRILRRMKYE